MNSEKFVYSASGKNVKHVSTSTVEPTAVSELGLKQCQVNAFKVKDKYKCCSELDETLGGSLCGVFIQAIGANGFMFC